MRVGRKTNMKITVSNKQSPKVIKHSATDYHHIQELGRHSERLHMFSCNLEGLVLCRKLPHVPSMCSATAAFPQIRQWSNAIHTARRQAFVLPRISDMHQCPALDRIVTGLSHMRIRSYELNSTKTALKRQKHSTCTHI